MAQFGRGSVRLFFKGDPTLVGNWIFDEGIGTVAKDLSGKGNNGTLTNGPLWVGGKLNSALKFDGIDDYVNTVNTISNSNKTLLIWIKPTSSMSSGLAIFAGNAAPTTERFYIGYSAGKFWLGGGNVSDDVSVSLLDTTTKWHFMVLVHSGTTMIAYQNGIRAGSVSWSGTNGGKINIGRAGGTDNVYFNGLIDEVAIFSRALSPKEIQSYYNWAIGKSTPIIYTPRKNASVLNVNGFLTQLLTETLTLTDNLLKTAAKVFSELITLTDNLIKSLIKNQVLIEILTLTDSTVKVFLKVFQEALTLTDNVFKGVQKALSEVLILTDGLLKGLNVLLIETITLTESFYKKARGLWQRIATHTTIWTKSETNPNVGDYALLTQNGEELLTQDGNVIIIGEEFPQTWQKESRHSTIWNKLP